MKKIKLLFLLFFITCIAQAQKSSPLERANFYLQEKGEVILKFKARNKQEFIEINKVVSLSHKHVDEKVLDVEAYANREQFQKFLTFGIPYDVTKEDNEIPQEYTAARATAAWDTSWDAYPKYSEYVAKMQYWAATYPTICSLQNIGTTALGRTLYVLKISDNIATDETEPEFFYSSSMHGDEITGYPVLLHLIDELLTSYGSNTEITNLINGNEIYFCPLANPDGSYKTAGNDIFNSAGNTPTRANSNGTDLNRNYPDPIGGLHPDGLAYRAETIAFLNFEATRNFVMAANYHGGAEVINFPWDTSNGATGTSQVNIHPHDAHFRHISTEYAQLCQTADGNLNYMDDVYGTGQFAGTTNGAIWYTVKGGRQDYNNYYNHNKEVTVEISEIKTPPASELPSFYTKNRQALLNLIKQAGYGLQGIVSDAQGKPIHAKVYITGITDGFGSWVETSATNGDYHKTQIAGSYNVIFEAPGYTSQTIPVTITNNTTTTLNVTMVPVTSLPTANDATICTGQTAALSATGTGTIKWYNSATSTSVLASTANYTTPALTSNTSYWVEREVTLANVGPTTVSGTAVNNTTATNRYMIFNCTTPTKLKSVLITNSAAGEILVELQNSSGVMLESKVIRLASAASQDIALDFFIPAQTGLRLVLRQINFNITRANSGITYPITNGTISITGNSGTGTFFPFFNWKFGPVKSNRDEVIVTVKPNPTNSSISPTSALAGSSAFTLTVNGTNFVNGESIVRWNGSNRTTTFVSATQLTAAITASDVTNSGTANVTIFNTCNSTTTSAQTFTIGANCTNPVPNVTTLPNINAQCSVTVPAPTATSNCYGTITGTTNNPTTYNSQGTYVINWTYNDGNGHISTQQQFVFITDTIAPVPNITNLPTLTGQCALTVTAPTATDNCMGTITATTSDPLTYNTQGSYNIIWTYTDNRGNQSFQSQTVVVDDTIAPVPNLTSLPTVNGQCAATVTAPTATDACAGTITATTTSPLTYNTQGTYNITWTYNDGNGNTSTQSQTVVVDDTIAPVANVASLPTVNGQCSANVTAPTASDACAGTITATTTSPLTYNTQGTYNITWTYNDGNGNTSTQSQTVVVDDTVAPVANLASLPTVNGQCTATVTAPTASDACAGTITATTTSPLTYNTQGTYQITWTYNDGNGNTSTQSQTVVVDDTVAPVANLASLPTVNGQCSATVTAPTATDACAGQITATTTSPLTYNTQGTYQITWTYNDGNGNTSTQSQTVVVDDTVAPVANVASLPTVNGQCSATVTAPTATDACAGQITATTTSPLTYNTQGTYNITWTYNDGNGNTSTQSQTVVVDDTVAPVANLASLPTVNGQCSATVTAPTATDACAGTITATTTSPLTYNTQGTYQITWTYNDGNGNTSTQSQTVVVDDTVAPVANLASLPTVNGQCSATVTAPTATDACAGQITATTTSPLTYNTQGTYQITWTYNDGNGNTSMQSQTVVVDDTVAPVANLASLPTVNGQCSATVTAPTATDACAGTITATTTSPLTYNTQGTYNITWTYNDGNGNTSTQSQTVVVDDTVAPVANVASLPTVNGQCSATVTAPTASDACAGQITATTTSPLTYNTQGTYQITWTYNDGNGNTSTQSQTVVVTNGGNILTFYQDLDGDTFGNPNVSVQDCSQPVGYVLDNTDCNDNQIQYADADNDGFGSTTQVACGVTNNTDCNDNDENQNVLITFYQDLDGDTFGNPNVSTQACSQPVGYVLDNTDCNDNQIQYADADNDGFGSTTQVACGVTNNTDCNDNDENQNVLITFYQDLDGDTFGNPNVSTQACSQPVGYVLDNTDCNDNQIQYTDADNDGFGSTTQVACGVTNNTDCNDNQIQYADTDNDGFGSITLVACGVTNNTDCNDNQLQYLDADNDGFGSLTLVDCGVLNNTDCNDNQLQYLDADNDGFGSLTLVDCGVLNNTDCNDNQLQYLDADNDGFGSLTLVDCGVLNNTDCNDNQLQYLDADNDGFGSLTLVDCGVLNNTDCNDNQLQYLDADNDGFGSLTLVDCGVTNNTDCNDNQLQYLDADNDGFGSLTLVDCGVTNNTDCNDNQLQYLDTDNDGFGSLTLVACGVTNNTDCNDNQLQYLDTDNDGFGSLTLVACGVLNNTDCNDNQLQYLDADNDGFGSITLVACGVLNNTDCNDNQLQYLDADNDGFGSLTLVDCGVLNNTDCNDNQLQYLDADNDGFGSLTLVDCGVLNNTDCNDNQLQYLDADNDGFGSLTLVDCGVTNNTDCNDNQIQYADADNDGFGSTIQVACGVTNNTDCNDNDENQNVLITFYQDLDGDTFGNPNVSTQACSQPIGYVLDNSDCNDNQIQYADADNDGFGSTTQVACGVTNNTDCNDNDENQNVLITFYQDLDGDTFGNPNVSTQACSQPVGYVLNNTDCNDNNPTLNETLVFYRDADGDGFGDLDNYFASCTQPVGYVLDNSDCNDNQIQYADADNDGFGSTTQVACGVTNNTDCNDNNATQNVLITFYQDLDGDTFGNPNVSTQACSQPVGYVSNNTDCDDNNASSTALISYYQDLDGDGFGNPLVVIQNCSQPIGYVISNTDCDDTRASVHPGAVDICYDGLDNDCNGIIDNNCTPIVSSVPTASCGSTISGLSTSVYATIVSGAQGYRFKITNTVTGIVQIFDRPVNNLAFSAIPGVTYNTQYQVEIGVKYNNVWQPFYGAPCFVNTPSPTSTIGAQCGTTLTTMNQWINATFVSSISAYRFRVTNTSTNEVQIVTTSMNKFNMTQVANRSYNTTYFVEVALRNTDGSFLPYGQGCNITTPFFPTTKLRDDKCGYVVYNSNELLPANIVSGATAYRFKIYNTALGYETILNRATSSFSISLLSGLVSGTSYKVQVSVQINNEFGPYGEECNISLPGLVDRASEINNVKTLNASIVPNPFSSVFNIKLENNSTENITINVYDLTGRVLENKTIQSSEIQSFSFGENYPSGVYNLILSQGDQVKSLRIIKR